MAEAVEEKVSNGPDLVLDTPGCHTFENKAGSLAFIRAIFVVTLSQELQRKLGLPGQPERKDTFLAGLAAALTFDAAVRRVANEFCGWLVEQLAEAGYRVTWRAQQGTKILRDGSAVGPGLAVFLRGGGCDPDEAESSEPGVVYAEIEAIANSLKYYLVDDGIKIQVPVRVEGIECGFVSGGRMYQAIVEHGLEEDCDFRARLIEEGAVLDTLRKNIAEIRVLMRQMPAGGARDIDWERTLAELMKGVKRRAKTLLVQDDAEVWEAIQDEIGMACPAFERLPESRRWEIFRRVKVRLGLADDD